MSLREYGPFHPELDETYQIVESLTPKQISFLTTQDSRRAWESLLGDSPTRCVEAEELMGRMARLSVINGQWTDLPCPRDKGLTPPYKVQDEWRGSILDAPRGATRLIEEGFARLTVDENGTYVLRPSEALVIFVRERIEKTPWYIPEED